MAKNIILSLLCLSSIYMSITYADVSICGNGQTCHGTLTASPHEKSVVLCNSDDHAVPWLSANCPGTLACNLNQGSATLYYYSKTSQKVNFDITWQCIVR